MTAEWVLTLAVIATVSGALIVGSLWGILGLLPDGLEGLLIALSGGALIVALMLELIEPAVMRTSISEAMFFVALGAAVFTLGDYLLDEVWGAVGGTGLLLAVTLDGIPENIALGTAFISSDVREVAALSASILMSNLPEAAGGSKSMCAQGMRRWQVLLIWTGTAVILSAAAIGGKVLVGTVGSQTLAYIGCFAAGAVVAALATEIFPRAFRAGEHLSGVAVALGLIMAFLLHDLGN